MTRITTTVFIFLLLMNGSVTVMSASGMNQDLGVELAPGISESMDSAVSQLRGGFQPSAGVGETLFSLFIAGLQIMGIVVDAITATPAMFLNLGFPSWIVFPLFVPMYAVSTFELIYVATGRDLV
jgi:hypothetical protein